MDTKAIRDELTAAIKELPALERQVLSLRYPEPGGEEACTFAEIGAVLHLPADRIEAIYWRAIAKLQPFFGDFLQ